MKSQPIIQGLLKALNLFPLGLQSGGWIFSRGAVSGSLSLLVAGGLVWGSTRVGASGYSLRGQFIVWPMVFFGGLVLERVLLWYCRGKASISRSDCCFTFKFSCLW